MIPKIIHYCWFGGKELPKSAKRCIESWRRYMPDYEIREWNEQNFDVHMIPFTSDAYASKKYAFVSDYARFWILYNHGGIYFDTDVEVIRPMDKLIADGPFMGREAGAYMKQMGLSEEDGLAVAPGLGIGAEKGMLLYKEILDSYAEATLYDANHQIDLKKTVVYFATNVLIKHGLNHVNDVPQRIEDVWIYPADYFCPMDHTQGNKLTLTDRTLSIHRYDCSWIDHNTMSYRLHILKNMLMRTFGVERISKLADFIKRR